MKLQYPNSEATRILFLNEFLRGASQPGHEDWLSSRLISAFETARTNYEATRDMRARLLARRVQLTNERDAALTNLRLLITQVILNLKLQIRKGVYPRTVPAQFGMTLTGYRIPRRNNQQLPLAQQLRKGYRWLDAEGLPTLTSPRLGELEAAIDQLERISSEWAVAKRLLAEIRQAVKREDRVIDHLHFQGFRALDMATVGSTRAERRAAKRNYGYRWRREVQETEPRAGQESATYINERDGDV